MKKLLASLSIAMLSTSAISADYQNDIKFKLNKKLSYSGAALVAGLFVTGSASAYVDKNSGLAGMVGGEVIMIGGVIIGVGGAVVSGASAMTEGLKLVDTTGSLKAFNAISRSASAYLAGVDVPSEEFDAFVNLFDLGQANLEQRKTTVAKIVNTINSTSAEQIIDDNSIDTGKTLSFREGEMIVETVKNNQSQTALEKVLGENSSVKNLDVLTKFTVLAVISKSLNK
jgi:hypothetical protein